MTSPQQTMPTTAAAAAAVQLLLPLLSLIYSVAVHIFLTSFNERSLLKFHHWHPILTRAIFCCVCVTFWRVTSLTSSRGPDDNISNDNGGNYNEAGVLFIPLAFITAILSMKFILQTRQIEINGPPPPPPVSTLKQDKVILITGANSGIGLETARLLYHHYNATVILACRSRARAMEAMQSIDPSWNECRHNSDNSSGSDAIRFGSRMHFLPLDLTSIQSIRTAVKIFLEEMKMPLHVLINNAGVMLNERMETVNGLEMTMAANHLGHFLLSNLLLPKLRETALNDKHPTKVIIVSSSLYTNAVRPRRHNNQTTKKWNNEPGIDLLDLQCQTKPYHLFEQYAQSKLANILFARELGRREKLQHGGLVQSHALHPGLVRTNVTRNMPWYLYYPNLVFSLFMMMLQKSPQCGAYTTVYCAVTDEASDVSCYFVNSKKQPLKTLALSDEEGRKLWKVSCQLMSLPLEKES